MREKHTSFDIQGEERQVRVGFTRAVVKLLDSKGCITATHPIQVAAGSVRASSRTPPRHMIFLSKPENVLRHPHTRKAVFQPT